MTEWRTRRLFISEGTGLATYIFLWVKGLWENGRANSSRSLRGLVVLAIPGSNLLDP